MKEKTKANISTLVLLLISVSWGLGYIATQDLLDHNWSSLGIMSTRFGIAGILCLLCAFKEKWWKNKSLLWRVAILGFVTFLGYFLQLEGQKRASIPNTAFFTALNVVMVPFLSMIFFKEKFSIKSIIAALVALIGITILSYDGKQITFSLGDLFNFLGAICFAIQISWLPSFGKYNSSFAVGGLQLIVMALCSFICMPFSPNKVFYGDGGWWSLVYLTVVTAFLAFVAQAYAQKHVKANVAAIMLGQEALFGSIFAVLLENEPITWQLIVGGIIVLSSVFIVNIDFSALLLKKKPAVPSGTLENIIDSNNDTIQNEEHKNS